MTFWTPEFLAGERAPAILWAREGQLARSHRPGYPSSRPTHDHVDRWVQAAVGLGIRSIVCLLEPAELQLYDSLDLGEGGLLSCYRRAGLAVSHIPVADYRIPPLAEPEETAVWEAFQRMEKPVLVQCSAGRDRTGAAVQAILQRVDGRPCAPGGSRTP
ncbi:MAG: tyrosine-protein phosphatase [Chloroflexi bacterium]|nr:tyrosine-protein phosphatase [Chloroflexota bacterium]